MNRRTGEAVFAAALAAYLAVFGYLVWRSAVLQPYSDMFSWLARYYQLQADGDWAGYLFAPYNFHRLAASFAVLALDIRAFGASGYLFIAVGAACLLATAAMLAREGAAAAGPALRLAGGGLAAMLVLMPSNVIDVSRAINTTYLHALVFVVAAVVLATPKDPAAGITPGRIGALICLAAAGFGNAAGLAVWPVLAAAAWRQGAAWSWRLTILAAGGAFVALYAWGQPAPGGAGPEFATSGLLFLNYLGLPWTRVAPAAGWLLGLGVLALAGAALMLRGGRGAARFERVAVQLILFSLATAAMAALGRSHEGPPSDVPLRYAPFMTPLHVGLTMLALPYLARVKAAQGLAAAAAVLLLVHELAAGVSAVRTGDVIRREIAAFHAGRRSAEMTTTIHPDLTFAAVMSQRLRADGLYQRELHLPAAPSR